MTICLLLAIALLAPAALAAAPADAAFGFKEIGVHFENENGTAANQAGSHPFAWRTTVLFNGGEDPGSLKDLYLRVPPGLIGTPHLLPECDRAAFILNACPDSSAVGLLSVLSEGSVGGSPSAPFLVQAPVHNLEPLPGSGAELGAFPEAVSFALPLAIQIGISSVHPHRLTASLSNVSQAAPVFGYQLTLWGDPADPAHDPYRGGCGAEYEVGLESFEPLSTGSCPFAAPAGAFLTLPSSCAAADAVFEVTSWSAPSSAIGASLPNALQPIGCGTLSYSPELRVDPTTIVAAAPSGLALTLDAPDPGIASPTSRAAADTERAVLELPPDLTLNPPVADGLAACTPAQFATEAPDSDPATGCPQRAKIGTAVVTTPLFEKPVAGAIYTATPHENPSSTLFALYVVLRAPDRGVLLSLPVRLDADPATGRLTATLDQVPQLPLSHLELHFNAGPNAPLSTPPGCGVHTIAYSLTPSSGNPPLDGTDSFATTSGCDTEFAPDLSSGTTSHQAGTGAPFVFEVTNSAAAANLSDLHLALPPGLAADLAVAATCPEGAAASAACPPDSRLGYARIALGSGPEPLWVPAGREPDSDVYLAGPHRGAPFSLLVSVPATAGPFDLGRVVLRAPVRIDPDTGQVSVELADLPQIRDGIPLQYRAIRLVLDRPGFIRNPTSCEPGRIELTATAASGAMAMASDRFQAADCAALGFRPRLAVRLFGRLGRNGHPRIDLALNPRRGEANLAAATFDLPAGELLDTRHIGALCARDLPPGRCPTASRLGRATISSPLLPDPLRGPIFLRAPGRRYPDLLAELRAGDVRLLLHGHTASAPGGRLRIHLPNLPDLPLSRAAISLAGGRQGIVVNSESLCGRPVRAHAWLGGQNGRVQRLRPRVQLNGSC